MNEQLSKKISVYNFISTLLIVIYHSRNFNGTFCVSKTAVTKLIFNFYDYVGSIAMGLFFLISGYLLYLGMNDTKDIVSKIKKRFSSLLIPFITWNTIMLIYNTVCGLINSDLDITFKDVLLGYSFVTFTGGFWYILALLLLLPFCPLVFRLKNRPGLFAVIVGLITVSAFICSMVWNVVWLSRLINYLPTYFLGAYFGLCKSGVISKEKYNAKWLSVAAFAVFTGITVYFVMGIKILWLEWILFRIVPVAAWLMFSSAVFAKVRITYPMKITFFVYAMHMFLIDVLYVCLREMIGYNSLVPVISVLVHFILIAVLYGICTLFAYTASKLLPRKIYSMLSGGRV